MILNIRRKLAYRRRGVPRALPARLARDTSVRGLALIILAALALGSAVTILMMSIFGSLSSSH